MFSNDIYECGYCILKVMCLFICMYEVGQEYIFYGYHHCWSCGLKCNLFCFVSFDYDGSYR